MKFNRKLFQVLSGLCILAGAAVVALTRNGLTADTAVDYGKWAGIGIMMVGMILLVPWGMSKQK
jgi:multidrug transporter EmrE-like cation transporter